MTGNAPNVPQLPSLPIAGGLTVLISLAIGLIMIVLAIVVWWRIFSKAGYSGALGLLMFVPLANFIVLLVLAFGTWPIEEEVRRLRQMGGGPRY